MPRLNSYLRAAVAVGVLALPLLGQAPAVKPGPWAGKGIFDVLEGVMSGDAATSAAASAELARRGPNDIGGTLTSAISVAGLMPDAEAQAGVRTERLVKALARLGPAAVPQLRVVIEHGGLEAALATATLGEIGPAAAKVTAPILVAAFANPDALVRGGAANAVVKLGPGAVPALLQGLVHSNDELRWHSARALGALKAEPRRVVPALIAALRDTDSNVRTNATSALGAFGAEALAAVPVLLDPAIGDEQDEVDFAQALAAIAVSSRVELVRALNAGRPIASGRAGLALGFGRPPAIDELIAALGNPSAQVRKLACTALIVAGAEAAKAAPAVAGLLQDADAKVRDEALRVLSSLGPAAGDVTAAVAARLADSDPDVRKSAADALAHVARTAEEMRPVLALFADSQAEVRVAAGWALARRPAGPASIPVLIRALGDPNPSVAGVAALAIGKLGTPAKEAVPPLVRLLESPDPAVRQRAAAGLKGIGPAAAAATTRLATALGSEQDTAGKRIYLEALAAIGPAAKAALPAVERCINDQDEGVRDSAQATRSALRGH